MNEALMDGRKQNFPDGIDKKEQVFYNNHRHRLTGVMLVEHMADTLKRFERLTEHEKRMVIAEIYRLLALQSSGR